MSLTTRLILLTIFAAPAVALSQQPNNLVDGHLQASWQAQNLSPAQNCSDETFARRVYLDVAGRIPTIEEAASFVQDTRSDKRHQLIDYLLHRPEYGRRMRDVFDVVLMKRAKQKDIDKRTKHGWHEYLEQSFANNRSWMDMTVEMLSARPTSLESDGSPWFLYERNNDYQAIAEAIGPAFFGTQIDCAQCHDHPLASEIEQRHYWGLVSFYRRGTNVMTKAGPRIAESAIGGWSEFADLTGDSQQAKLVFLESQVIAEEKPEGKETDSEDKYRTQQVSLSAHAPKVPKFSRRELFVERVARDNPMIARAMVNRIWAMLIGRGIVHPVDKMDSEHPPSHPKLLDALARDFESSGYDVKRLVRTILRSQAYQLATSHNDPNVPAESFAVAFEKPLTAEQYYASLRIAIDETQTADGSNDSFLKEFTAVFPDVFYEEFSFTLKQALFLSNNKTVHELVTKSPIIQQLKKLNSHDERVTTAFNRFFGRRPTTEEKVRCVAYLHERKDAEDDAFSQLLWALAASSEFRLNH